MISQIQWIHLGIPVCPVERHTYKNVTVIYYLILGIKEYSNWPTIPQIYMDGEFVGGCDILLDMHKSGELIEELKKVGITSALLDPSKNE